MAKLGVMVVMIISLIVAVNAIVIAADNMIDSMIPSKIVRSVFKIFKIVLFIIIIKTVGWVSLLAFVGYGVVQYKRARIAINHVVNVVHSMLTR